MKYIEYARMERDEACFICRAVESQDPDRDLVLHRSGLTVVLMNKYPYNTGHLLVAPARHVPDLSALSREEICELGLMVRRSIEMLRRALSPDGFNIGINLGKVAGAGLEAHLHVHVVPRWLGDTNFMPVISNTKVIPEALNDTYMKLKKYADYLRKNDD